MEATTFVCPQCGYEDFQVDKKFYDEFENIDSQLVICNVCGCETYVEWDG